MITENKRKPRTFPLPIRFAPGTLFLPTLTLLLALCATSTSAQTAVSVAADASGVTVNAGYKTNCPALLAGDRLILSELQKIITDLSVCAITRRIAQARLNSAGTTETGQHSAFWGGGDYRRLNYESDVGDWDGDLFAIRLGADARLRDDLLVGLAVSREEVDIDYAANAIDGARQTGDYQTDLTSLHPYIGWSALDGRLNLWAMAGYGKADLEVTPVTLDGHNAPSSLGEWTMQTVSFGGSKELLKRGASELRLKADALQARLEFEGRAGDPDASELSDLVVNNERFRVALEAIRTYTMVDEARLEPALEVGVFHDGGNGETGNSAEVVVRLRYTAPSIGLTVDGGGRALIWRSNGYRKYYDEWEWDWNISGGIRLAADADGQGLSFSLSPGYGEIAEQQKRDMSAQMNARLGYGLPSFGGGLLTPYGETTFGGASKRYRLGMHWALGSVLDLELIGERREKENTAAKHAVLLTGKIRF